MRILDINFEKHEKDFTKNMNDLKRGGGAPAVGRVLPPFQIILFSAITIVIIVLYYCSVKGRVESVIVLTVQILLQGDGIAFHLEVVGSKRLTEYSGAAKPPVRCGGSHLSGLTEPHDMNC